MTATVLETDTRIELAPPCEAVCHEQTILGLPAEFNILVTCVCGINAQYDICLECLNIMLSSVLGCYTCGMVDPGTKCIKIIGKI